MLVAIFGAGASYDSYQTVPPTDGYPESARPPLTVELFSERFSAFVDEAPQARSLVGVLRDVAKKGDDVEAYLERIRIEADDDPELSRQLAAIRLYIFRSISAAARQWRDRTRGVTNYEMLVERLRRRSKRTGDEHAFLTFNYDTLLDDAWQVRYRVNLADIDVYLASSGPPLIHLHGNVRWYRPILNPGVIVTQGIQDGVVQNGSLVSDESVIDSFGDLALGEIAYSSYFGYTGTGLLSRSAHPEVLGIPAIAIPVRSKIQFECPRGHIGRAEHVLGAASKVLIIGWRGREDYFLERWRSNQHGGSEVLIACRDSDEGAATRDHLAAKGIAGRFEIFNGGFSALLQSRELENFLGEPVGGP